MQLRQSHFEIRIGLAGFLVLEKGSIVFYTSKLGAEIGDGLVDFGPDVGVELFGEQLATLEVQDYHWEFYALIELDSTLLIGAVALQIIHKQELEILTWIIALVTCLRLSDFRINRIHFNFDYALSNLI